VPRAHRHSRSTLHDLRPVTIPIGNEELRPKPQTIGRKSATGGPWVDFQRNYSSASPRHSGLIEVVWSTTVTGSVSTMGQRNCRDPSSMRAKAWHPQDGRPAPGDWGRGRAWGGMINGRTGQEEKAPGRRRRGNRSSGTVRAGAPRTPAHGDGLDVEAVTHRGARAGPQRIVQSRSGRGRPWHWGT